MAGQMAEQVTVECGWCVSKNQNNLFVGWKGWYICEECLESLIKVRALSDPSFRERLIGELTELKDNKPPSNESFFSGVVSKYDRLPPSERVKRYLDLADRMRKQIERTPEPFRSSCLQLAEKWEQLAADAAKSG